jgi:hypothetical protein
VCAFNRRKAASGTCSRGTNVITDGGLEVVAAVVDIVDHSAWVGGWR